MSLFRFIFSKVLLKQIFLACIIFVALIFGMLWWLGYSTNHGQKLEVPNLSKLTLDEVEKVLDQHQMRYVILDSANFNPEYTPIYLMNELTYAAELVISDMKS